MREILFRGKRSYNNSWVYGNLIFDNYNKPHIVENDKFYEDGHHLKYEDETDKPVFFDEHTLGQYTGINDINGNKIFEGDIVHCISRTDEANMVIIFESGAFHMIPCEKYHNYVHGCGYFEISWFDKEVIGNIHDNYNLIV